MISRRRGRAAATETQTQTPTASRYPTFFLQRRDGVERPVAWRGRRYWIVARSLCRFRRFPLTNVGHGDLKEAAALKARAWAPYPALGFHLHLTSQAAAIWIWDAARVDNAMRQAGVKPGRLATIPETAFQARAADGLHLIQCSEGVEGQCWANGELKASRWWAGTPSSDEWLEFQRVSGSAANIAPTPSVEQPVRCARPWTNTGKRFELERRARQAVIGGAVALLAAYGYLGGSLFRDLQSSWEADRKLAALQEQSAPAMADREAALTNLDFLNAFKTLDPYPAQLSLFARVADKLPANGAQLATWSYRQGDLQFTVFSPASPPDVLFYVKTYSMIAGFADVTADRGMIDRSLRVKLRVARQ
jgi:hypothetical protein